MPQPPEDRRNSFPTWLEWARGASDSLEDLSHLLNEPSTSDMIIRGRGQDLPCHQHALLQPRRIGFSEPPQTVIPLDKHTLTMLPPLHTPPPLELPECPICLEPIRKPIITPCGHVFHARCINRAINLHKKCPMCRDPIAHSSWCMETEMPAPTPAPPPQPGIEFDCEPDVMRSILRVIYTGHYGYGMRDHWSQEVVRGLLIPRSCLHWERHLDVFLASVRLDIGFADMQKRSLFAYTCLVREFALMADEPLVHSDTFSGTDRKERAKRQQEEGVRLMAARSMLEKICKLQLENEAQKAVVIRPVKYVWRAWRTSLLGAVGVWWSFADQDSFMKLLPDWAWTK